MTWTYSGDPAASDLDAVRFTVGDTDKTDELVQNEEISYVLGLQANDINRTGAVVCEAISARFAREVDSGSSDLKESASQKAKAYRERAKELRALAGIDAEPVFGGITLSELETRDLDTNAVQPSFRVGQDDNPDAIDERRTEHQHHHHHHDG